MYSIMPTVNNTVLCTEKFVKQVDFKCSYHKKRVEAGDCGYAYYLDYGDGFCGCAYVQTHQIISIKKMTLQFGT